MNRLVRMLMFACLALVSVGASAQMGQFKALYIYNFAKNIGWPEADSGSEFVITIVGDNELSGELEKLAKTRMIGSRKVVVRQAATVSAAGSSQIVYLGESKSGQMSQLVASQSGGKVLIVGGKPGLCSSGAGISFVPVDGKLKYEISQNNIKKFGLQVSAKILQLGIEVN